MLGEELNPVRKASEIFLHCISEVWKCMEMIWRQMHNEYGGLGKSQSGFRAAANCNSVRKTVRSLAMP